MVDDTTSNKDNCTALDTLSKLGAQFAKTEEWMKNFPQIKTPEELGPLGESMMKLEEMLNKPVQQPVAVEKEPVQQPKTSDSIVKILEKAEHFLGTLYLWSKTKNIFLRVLFWFVAFLVFAEIFFSAINNGIGACEWFFSLSIWD